MRRAPSGGVGFEAARRRLGLPRWRLRLAIEGGLLARDAAGYLASAQVEAAAGSLSFLADLRDQERLVSWQAAELLGISLGRFREAVAAALFVPTETRMFRRGETRYFRRADLENGREALSDWLSRRTPLHVVPGSAAALARRSRRAASVTVTRAARGKFVGERAALAALAPSEREIGALAFWLDLLEGHRARLVWRAERSRRPRVVAGYRAGADVLAGLRDAALEALVLTGQPLVSTRIGGQSLKIIYCPACAADPAAADPARMAPPGCPNCRVELSGCHLRVDLALSGGLRSFGAPLSAAVGFAASGRLDPRELRAPCPFLVNNVTSAFSLAVGGRPANLPAAAWAAMNAAERRAAVMAELARRLADYAAGRAPAEEAPAWLLALPHDGGPNPPTAMVLGEPMARAVPAGEVIGGLIAAVERVGGFRLVPPALAI